ncbi:hypothetical protein AHAS_Ahas07G0095600 [Arachis hypogaea]
MKDVLLEFVNLIKQMIHSSQQARKLTIQNENSLHKSQSQVDVLLKYIDFLEDDQVMSKQEEDLLRTEDEGSDI